MTTIYILADRWGLVEVNCTRLTRSNPTATQDHFGQFTYLKLPIPAFVIDYNRNKVGIDIVDQYWYYHSTQLITLLGWFPVFFWILDTALINFFIIFRDLEQYTGLTWRAGAYDTSEILLSWSFLSCFSITNFFIMILGTICSTILVLMDS